MSRDEEVVLVELSEDSSEYRTVVQSIDMTLRNKIDAVERVQKPYLWGSYVLKKEEYINCLGFDIVSEEKLFHATAKENVYSVVQNNFDCRRTKRTRYGHGVSFSPSAEYANTYCNEKAESAHALSFLQEFWLKWRLKYTTKIPLPPFTKQSEKIVKS